MMPFNGHGSYLIRDSESSPGDYALSLRDREKVKHYQIKQFDNGTVFIDGAARGINFETLAGLVAHYQQQAGGLCVNLIHPCKQISDIKESR